MAQSDSDLCALCKQHLYTLMSESSTAAEQGSDTKPLQMQRENIPQGMQELHLNLCFILGAWCEIGGSFVLVPFCFKGFGVF